MARLIRFLERWPVIPVVGSGRSLQQPVYVKDVTSAVVAAMEADAAIGSSYNIAGATPLTFIEVISTITEQLGRKVLRLHLPIPPIVATLGFAERVGLPLPVKQEQILRLNEDKVFGYDDATRDFGYSPITFAEGVRRELMDMYP